MFSAMEFARIGIVPVHVLRGLEVAGLLVPRRTGPDGGRRLYDAGQLPRLNRILVLTDLGFTLLQVRAILDTRLSEPELRGLLRLRRAELAARVNADTARLERVAARLTVLAQVDDPPEPPAAQCWPGGTTPRNPPLRCAPRGGTSPAHRPLTGPEGPVRWAGTSVSPQPAHGARRWDRPLTGPEARFAGPVRTPRRSLSALLADRPGA